MIVRFIPVQIRMTTTAFIEPLLVPDEGRYTLFPIKYNDVYEMYTRQIDLFWQTNEVNLAIDLNDWSKLSGDEKYFISMVLAFFSSSDGIVTENLAVRFMRDIEVAEVRAFYGFQIAMETIHSEMYSKLIDCYIRNKDEKHKLFNAVENFPCIAKKANWAKKWLNDTESPFAHRLVAFAAIEGIFFSASFCSIYWFKKRGLLPGLTFSNELISRDEALHCEFAVLLFSKIVNKPTQKQIHEIIGTAVDIEKEFILNAIPCRLIGMNHQMMSTYIEFVADRLCLQLGYDKIYGSKNPFDFMELISIQSKVNFFERTNSEYSLANRTMDDNIFELSTEF